MATTVEQSQRLDDLHSQWSDFQILFDPNLPDLPLESQWFDASVFQPDFTGGFQTVQNMDGILHDGIFDPHISGNALPEAVTMEDNSMDVHLSGGLDAGQVTEPTSLAWTGSNVVISTTLEQANNQAESSATAQKRRAPQPRIPEHTRKILETYYSQNTYPAAWEVELIARETELEVKRVRNWFSNARARRPVEVEDEHIHPKSDQISHQLRAPLSKESLEKLEQQPHPEQQRPIEKWVNSSLRSEPASVAAIESAVERRRLTSPPLSLLNPPRGKASRKRSASNISRPASVVSARNSSAGSAKTRRTSYTTSSKGSHTSSYSRGSRRGRKRFSLLPAGHNAKLLNKKQEAVSGNFVCLEPKSRDRKQSYFCTFCFQRFKNHYEWARHEESVHVPQETWVCCSKGFWYQNCSFGGAHLPGGSAYYRDNDCHKERACRSKPEESRTFYRRDQFIRHIHDVHYAKRKHPDPLLGCSKGSTSGCAALVKQWRRAAPPLHEHDPALHCGFCGVWFLDWEQRRSHVSGHFKEGNKDVSTWWPGRLPQQLSLVSIPQHSKFKRCRYCRQIFHSSLDHSHTKCEIWSCRFLGSIESLASECGFRPDIPQQNLQSHIAQFFLGQKEFFLTPKRYRSYRECNQDFFQSALDFCWHLRDFHGAVNVSVLENYDILEENFSRTWVPVFEPVEDGPGVDAPDKLAGRLQNPTSAPTSRHFSAHSAVNAVPEVNSRRLTQSLSLSIPKQTSSTKVNQVRRENMHTNLAPTSERTTRLHTHTPSSHSTTLTGRSSDPSMVISDLGGRGPELRLFERLKCYPPRFFHTIFSPLPGLYYLKGSKTSSELDADRLGLVELSNSYIGSLVMTSTLVGMAGSGWAPSMERDDETGLIEFAMED